MFEAAEVNWWWDTHNFQTWDVYWTQWRECEEVSEFQQFLPIFFVWEFHFLHGISHRNRWLSKWVENIFFCTTPSVAPSHRHHHDHESRKMRKNWTERVIKNSACDCPSQLLYFVYFFSPLSSRLTLYIISFSLFHLKCELNCLRRFFFLIQIAQLPTLLILPPSSSTFYTHIIGDVLNISVLIFFFGHTAVPRAVIKKYDHDSSLFSSFLVKSQSHSDFKEIVEVIR